MQLFPAGLIKVHGAHSRSAVFTPAPLAESAAVLNNPWQGFYHIVRYVLTGGEPPVDTPAASQARAYDLPLVLLEINLSRYRAGALSAAALAQLDAILQSWAACGAQIILRFLYDWDGVAAAREPQELSTVLTHMEQAGQIVNRYAAAVFIMQGLFVGNWGEMHGSRFMDGRSARALALRLHESIAPCVYLAVRTPAQWRQLTRIEDVPAEFSALRQSGVLAGRLGLYNDGMLGSLSDLGTYRPAPRQGAGDPSFDGIRRRELAFQNKLCRYVPNGGEVVYNTPYNDLPEAVDYLKTIHGCYLNADYDRAVLEKWSRTIWNDSGAFCGCDGLTYIQAHLGYRYAARRVTLRKTGAARPTLELCVTLENTGFGSALKPLDAAFVFRSAAGGQAVRLPIRFDFCVLQSGQKAALTASLPAQALPYGRCGVYLSVTDPASGRQIALANTAYHAENGLLLGQLEL